MDKSYLVMLNHTLSELNKQYQDLKEDPDFMYPDVELSPKLDFVLCVKSRAFGILESSTNSYDRKEIYNLDEDCANTLQKLESELGLSKNTLVRVVPFFEEGLIRTIFCSASIDDERNDKTLDDGMELQIGMTFKKNLCSGQISVDFQSKKLTKSRPKRISLPYGKRLHARD